MNINDLTVIIPTKNEEKNIISFLNSLPPAVKLLVVDSSTDKTRELVNIHRSQNSTVIFKECNIPKARQIGAEHSSTEWILYSDADMIFDSIYFQNLEKINIPNNTGAIMGAKLSRDKFRWYYRAYSFSIKLMSYLSIPIGSGSNMILRKSALENIGGFDLSLSHSEDNDILWRIRKEGYKVISRDQLRVYEMDHRRLEKGVFKKFIHGSLRAFFLITGINRKNVQKSDWGYWD